MSKARPISSRIRLTIAILSTIAAPASAQDIPRLRLGGGAAMSGSYPDGWGSHALADLSLRPEHRVDVRGSASFAHGSFQDAGADSDVVAGLDALALIRLGPIWLGGGLGYSYSRPAISRPFAYDLGPTVVVEYDRGAASGWFAAARIRGFGNYFYSEAATQGLLLLSLGLKR